MEDYNKMDLDGYFEFKMDYERSINLAKAEKANKRAEKAEKTLDLIAQSTSFEEVMNLMKASNISFGK